MPLTRRQLLSGLTLAAASYAFSEASSGAPPFSPSVDERVGNEDLRINATRLQRSLEGLSVFGRPSGGTFADGVSRVAYSDADVAGRKYAMQLMRDSGLDPHIDAGGNITATRPGSDSSLKPILFGSHIDSVPSGGNFDGDFGSMSAIEVMHTLNDHKLTTRHPLRICIWQNEEGALVGSQIAAGVDVDMQRQFNGLSTAEGIRKIGGDPTNLAQARIPKGSFACYLELHIEQGGTLDRAGIPIGVVEGIVAIDEYEVEIHGFANHAGTTPMPERRNALLAAAMLIEAVQKVVTSEPGRQVGTVGRLAVYPNAPNVVPGRVVHTIELRDLSAEKIARLGAEIQKQAQQIAAQTHTEITMKQVASDPPAMASPEIQKQIEAAAANLGLKTMRLPSGAGHDAQMMATLGPMGMIFVPSVGGISHSPKELTHWQDCANGANVLLHTLLRMDALG
jgi:N-carbamoyl-L-amino-acid hydrolase